jgi:hypothetical protein
VSVQSPRTAREALLAEVLDEVDSLHRQVLALPDSLVAMEVKLARTVSVLDQAADNFRIAVTAFSEQAKVDLVAFHERKTVEASNRILDEQLLAIQSMVNAAMKIQSNQHPSQGLLDAGDPIDLPRPSVWIRLAEYGFASLVTSTFMASLIVWLR